MQIKWPGILKLLLYRIRRRFLHILLKTKSTVRKELLQANFLWFAIFMMSKFPDNTPRSKVDLGELFGLLILGLVMELDKGICCMFLFIFGKS